MSMSLPKIYRGEGMDKIVRALLRMLRNISGEGLVEGSHGHCLNYPRHRTLQTLGPNKRVVQLERYIELSE